MYKCVEMRVLSLLLLAELHSLLLDVFNVFCLI